MQERETSKQAMKWFITIIASLLFVFSTTMRVISGQSADVTLGSVFLAISGLVWGANIADYFKKLK